MNSPLQAAALRYAAGGWPVFLLGRTKRPLALCNTCQHLRDTNTAHDPQACTCLTCHGFYAATRNPDTIAAMFTAYPGGLLAIRTGTPSGLVVVDVDPDHGGLDSLAALIRDRLTPSTRFVHTGSGGLHLYYRHPGGRIACSAGRLAPGIDIRGDGGYVVAPPSRHPGTRRAYRWADRRPVLEMARPLLDAIKAEAAPTVTASRAQLSCGRAGAISNPARLLQTLLDKVRHAPPGRTRTTLYGVSRGVARIVAAGALTSTDAYTTLMEVSLAKGQTAKSSRAAITGGFTDEGVTLP